MQDYRDFGPEELAADSSFQQWKLNDDPEASTFWNEWLHQNPDRHELVAKADLLLTTIRRQYEQRIEHHFRLSDEEVKREVNRLRQSLDAGRVKPFRWIQFAPIRYGIAASVLAVLGLLGWYALRPKPAETYSELVAQVTSPLVEVENTKTEPLTVKLPDQSTIVVYAQSRVSYPRQFLGNKREVYLQGRAFFSVAKNPSSPFYVYANRLVTKVLGTSFSVQTDESNRQVKVEVRTGKVSVYAADEKPAANPNEDNKLTGVVLTPNQQIVFSPNSSRIVKGVVANPAVLNLAAQQRTFTFNNTPISEVFATLEQVYGIEIEHDANLMQNCYLTASLSDEPLFQKLDLICRTVNATYEQMDGYIVVNARGCDQ